MFVGPVFFREATTTPRRTRHYLLRAIYVLALLVLICTAWLMLAGTQIIRDVGDMARFGAVLFRVLAPLQLTVMMFFAAFGVASAVALEKDRRTFILLLMTRLRNNELVLGNLFAALLDTLVMLSAAAPVLVLMTLLGGISLDQVVRVLFVTLVTMLAVGSLGSLLALWREKTFQTLALTALILGMYLGLCEAIYQGLFFTTWGGLSCQTWAAMCSPFRAILVAAEPSLTSAGDLSDAVQGFLFYGLGLTCLLNTIAIARVRVWNPSREVRLQQPDSSTEEAESLGGAESQGNPGAVSVGESAGSVVAARPSASSGTGGTGQLSTVQRVSDVGAEVARAGHVDARRRTINRESRPVWDNPILWREVRTWAYGRKVLVIRLAYLLLFAMSAVALQGVVTGVWDEPDAGGLAGRVPVSARILAPFFLVSLVIMNALAVNSITNERDGQALDLLLVTDLTSQEFVFGKMGGVLWLTKEMILLPLVLCSYLWWQGGITLENVSYLMMGLLVLDLFVTMLGLHFGMNYANSRHAISASLSAVFFLFLGVVTCLVIMISFSGSFEVQYAPFLAFIGGGSLGLYVSLGIRNASSAIFWASLLLPIATFFCVVSFVLGNRELTIFLVMVATYGFTTAALLVPAISEFDLAMGRTKSGQEE